MSAHYSHHSLVTVNGNTIIYYMLYNMMSSIASSASQM
jgi:hypothetical protein